MVVIRLELVHFHHKNICSTYTAKSYLAEEIFVKLISFHTARQMQYLLFGVGGHITTNIPIQKNITTIRGIYYVSLKFYKI